MKHLKTKTLVTAIKHALADGGLDVVTCDQPDVRILATQNTDADGKATGKWRLDLFNPADKAMDVKLAIDPNFSLIKTRTSKASVPAGGNVALEIE